MHAQEELRLSELRYRSLVEATAAIVWNTPASGEFESEQPQWSAFTGQSFDQLKGRGWLDAVHPEDRQHTSAVWAHARNNCVVYQVEHRLRRRDGQYRYMAVRAAPIIDDFGAVREWIGIHTDVTEQRRAEQSSRFLAQASEMLHSSMDYSAALSNVAKLIVPAIADWCAFDLAGAHGSVRRVAVHHSDPLKLQAVRELHKEHPPRMDEGPGLSQVLRDGRPQFWPDLRPEQIDGAIADPPLARLLHEAGIGSAMIVPMTARGKVLGAITLAQAESGRRFDGVDLALAEDLARRAGLAVDDALLYAEARDAVRSRDEVTVLLDTLLEKAPVGFALFNHDLRYLRVNEEMVRLDGVPPHEHWGRTVRQVLPQIPDSFEQALARVRDTGEAIFSEEVAGRTPADPHQDHDFLLRLYPVRTSTQNLGVAAIILDITERKAAERELRLTQDMLRRSNEQLESLVDVRTAELQSANARLVASNRQLEDFASVASHDLQEPLRKIRAFGDRLAGRAGPHLDEESRDYLRRMLNAALRMQTLISDLLTFARITTKAQPFTRVDLGQIAVEVLGDLESSIEGAGGSVDMMPLPTIDADPLQMRQLLQNLIANALKFRKADVPPHVRVSSSFINEGGACQILIEDNGIGFDEKYLDRIFNVFQRLHGRGEYEGTGIGLAVCRKIAQWHGGSITAHSRVGEGSTFIVTLPVQHPVSEESRG
jgi:PAS domain S-box-containing protein